MADTSATCRLTKDGHFVWIAAEVGDVSLNPLQGVTLVVKTEVAWSSRVARRKKTLNQKKARFNPILMQLLMFM